MDVPQFIEKKKKKEKIVMITAYDYLTALIIDEVGIDGVLVGDSLGMVIKGEENTLNVELEEVIYHTKAVKKGTKNALIVADMPFLSYQISKEKALDNAGKLIKAGAQAVKIEGGEEVADKIEYIIKNGIPVMGHLGMTPQFVNIFGKYKVIGRKDFEKRKLKNDAKILENIGVFSIVLECITHNLAKEITESLKIPTIGIGAGLNCDGQILVFQDVIGLTPYKFKFVKRYANLREIIKKALEQYKKEVKEEKFPSEEFWFD